MDYCDERYVRLYVRDTATWKAIGWTGQTVFMHLLRKVDRAGVLDFSDDGVEIAVQDVTGLPADLVEPGLAKLIMRKVVTVSSQSLVIVNFIEAQEAHQSDKQRMREYRARRRDRAHHGVTPRNDGVKPRNGPTGDMATYGNTAAVTPRHDPATPRSATVTPRSATVTLSCTVPSRTDLSQIGKATAKDLTGTPIQPLQPGGSVGANGKIPCPIDLWEQMSDRTKASMDTCLIARDAQEYLCRGFTMRYAGRDDDLRSVHQWVASAVRAIQSDWNDPRKRPTLTKQPAAAAPIKFRRFR